MMGHEAVLILIPKERAKNSFEARNFVLLTLEEIEEKRLYGNLYEYSIGGKFSGLLSKACGGEPVLPYYNKEMREVVRKGIGIIADFIKGEIENGRDARILASDIKKDIPEFEAYNDGDLLDALRLEFKGITIDIGWHNRTNRVIYVFKSNYIESEFQEQFWEKTGRYKFVELGYEDDAMIVNECLYREVINKMKEKVIDIDKGYIEKEDIAPEKIIEKKWVVLVDAVD